MTALGLLLGRPRAECDLLGVFGVRSRRCELSEFFADHVVLHLDGEEFLAIVHVETVTDELGKDRGGTGHDTHGGALHLRTTGW